MDSELDPFYFELIFKTDNWAMEMKTRPFWLANPLIE